MNFTHLKHDFVFPDLDCTTLPTGRHYTTPEGNRYPSITTVLGATSDKSGLDDWRNKIGHENADQISKEAARHGTAVHDLTEKYLNNDPNYAKGSYFIDLISLKAMKSTLDENITDIFLQEKALYSDRLKIAGRVDCIAKWNGKLSIIDFKTSRKQKRAEWIKNYFIQETFYACAFYELTKVPIQQIVTIICVEDELVQIFIEQPFKYIKDLVSIRSQYDQLASEPTE